VELRESASVVQSHLSPAFRGEVAKRYLSEKKIARMVAERGVDLIGTFYLARLREAIDKDGLRSINTDLDHLSVEEFPGQVTKVRVQVPAAHLKSAAMKLAAKVQADLKEQDSQLLQAFVGALLCNVFVRYSLTLEPSLRPKFLELLREDPVAATREHRDILELWEDEAAGFLAQQMAQLLILDWAISASLEELATALGLLQPDRKPSPEDYLRFPSSKPFQSLVQAYSLNEFVTPRPGQLQANFESDGCAHIYTGLPQKDSTSSDEDNSVFDPILKMDDRTVDAFLLMVDACTRKPQNQMGEVLFSIDELLDRSGRKQKLSGSGRRGGYEDKQRKEMLTAVRQVLSTHLYITVQDYTSKTPTDTTENGADKLDHRAAILSRVRAERN